MKWYKMQLRAMYDIKFKRLKKIGRQPFAFYWTAWCIMLDYGAESGGVVKYSDDDEREIIFEMLDDLSLAEIDEIIDDLEAVDLISNNPNEIIIKNWEKYQSSQYHGAERVQKHRENKAQEETITRIINELNKMLDKRYSEKTESTRSSIRARLDAGNTEEELLAVVAWKQRDWGKKPEMEKFIRPSTLFRPGNFDNYLNEIPRDVLKATVDGTLLKVRNLYGKISHVTQEQFDKASPGFLSIV